MAPRKAASKQSKTAKKKATPKKPFNSSDYILGFDAEWVARDDGNDILSYQWHMITPLGKAGGLFLVKDLKGKKRLELSDFVGKALEEAKRKALFKQYPKGIVMVAHFSLADLNAFEDFHEAIKATFDNVRKTYVSLREPTGVEFTDSNGHKRAVDVTLRDSKIIAPAGSKLEDLGELHGLLKIKLPAGMIEQMDVLLKQNPTLFKEYAVRDAEVTALHASKMAEKARDLTDNYRVPISLGGMAIDYCEVLWEKAGINKLDVLGREISKERVFDEKKGRWRTIKREVDITEVHENLLVVTECYHGGRNESFFFGATKIDDWRDIDLVGAYSTAMASMGLIQWNKLKHTTDIGDFKHDTVGYARIQFDFPSSCRFPGLPVRTDGNLIFPRRGRTYVTAPEIAVALEQGCKIKIEHGLVIPVDKHVKPIFEVVKTATDGRIAAKKQGDVLEDKLYKELINSFYGKFAQGLRKKRVFSTTSGETEDMEPSRVSQAYIAAHITGLVRAVLSEIMNAIPERYTVISVTTDGFICNAPEDVTEAASGGRICALLKATRKALTGNDTILEDKHAVRQVLSWRTRGQATLVPCAGSKLILAKAGLRSPYGMTATEQNDWITEQFLDRKWDTQYSYERLRGLRSIYDEGGDLVEIVQTQRMNMDFDFKCRVDKRTAGMCDICGKPHLCFKTLPWMDVDDYLVCRGVKDDFATEKKRCLRALEDLGVYTGMIEARNNLSGGLRHSPGGTLGDALKVVVRAMVHAQWGLSKGGLSNKQWVAVFKRLGYKVTVDMFKKAKAAGEAPDHSIEMTPETFSLNRQLKKRFPDFDHNKFFAAIKGKDKDSEVWD